REKRDRGRFWNRCSEVRDRHNTGAEEIILAVNFESKNIARVEANGESASALSIIGRQERRSAVQQKIEAIVRPGVAACVIPVEAQYSRYRSRDGEIRGAEAAAAAATSERDRRGRSRSI